MSSDDWESIMQRVETDVEEQPFPTAEYERRLAAVQDDIASRDLDGLVATTPESINYLTGYDTTGYHWYQSLVVPAEGTPGFVISDFELPNVLLRTWVSDYRMFSIRTRGEASTRSGAEATAEMLDAFDLDEPSKRIGFESDSITMTHERLEAIRNASQSTFVAARGIVETPRGIKSENEIDYMREAGDIVGPATMKAIETIEPGVNENELAATMFYEAIRNGSGHVGTQQYVTSGTRSAVTHSRWKGRTIEEGDVVYFETTSAVYRYHSSIMRTAYVGDPPETVEHVADVVLEALDATIDAIEPGVPASAVDRACRDVIEGAGYGEHFVHMTGYSIGLSYPPGWGNGHVVTLGPDDDTELQPDMTFHLPIIVFLPDHGAIGFSETVRVTEDGTEELVNIPRKLFRV